MTKPPTYRVKENDVTRVSDKRNGDPTSKLMHDSQSHIKTCRYKKKTAERSRENVIDIFMDKCKSGRLVEIVARSISIIR